MPEGLEGSGKQRVPDVSYPQPFRNPAFRTMATRFLIGLGFGASDYGLT